MSPESRIALWFTVGLCALAVYFALALEDVSWAFLWPFPVVIGVSVYKLWRPL